MTKRSLGFWNGLKTKGEKWLLIGSTYANAWSWDILQRRKGPSHLTESIKTLNGKSCSPEVITTIIGSFICAGLSWKLFLCSQAGEKEGVWGRFMGQLVHQTPPKYWHSNSVVVVVVWRQKCSTPGNIDIPTWAFYCLQPTVVSARCSAITLNCLPFRPPEALVLTGKLLFIVSKAEKLRNSQSTHIYIFDLLFIFCEI